MKNQILHLNQHTVLGTLLITLQHTGIYVKRVLHPNLKLLVACFVCYLEIINTFLKMTIEITTMAIQSCLLACSAMTSKSKLSKKLKNGMAILVGQAVFKIWIKTVKILFLFFVFVFFCFCLVVWLFVCLFCFFWINNSRISWPT